MHCVLKHALRQRLVGQSRDGAYTMQMKYIFIYLLICIYNYACASLPSGSVSGYAATMHARHAKHVYLYIC